MPMQKCTSKDLGLGDWVDKAKNLQYCPDLEKYNASFVKRIEKSGGGVTKDLYKIKIERYYDDSQPSWPSPLNAGDAIL